MATTLVLTCALLALSATMCCAQLQPLSLAQKQVFLDAHNRLRAKVAKGEVSGQPGSSNMPAMEWDDRLMQSAARWVEKCIAGHDEKEDRAMPKYSWVGQNFAAGSSEDLASYVQMWFDEQADYTLESNSCASGKVCGHYTQVVWAKSLLVGCAVARCSQYPIHVICNYGPGGNWNGEKPYEKGVATDGCDHEYVYKDNGLCIRKDQCETCPCSVTSCKNGGTLDSANCRCTCPTGFYGPSCQKPCEDDPSERSTCEAYPTAVCSHTYFKPLCKKTCNTCLPSTVGDNEVVNPDNVKCRSPN